MRPEVMRAFSTTTPAPEPAEDPEGFGCGAAEARSTRSSKFHRPRASRTEDTIIGRYRLTSTRNGSAAAARTTEPASAATAIRIRRAARLRDASSSQSAGLVLVFFHVGPRQAPGARVSQERREAGHLDLPFDLSEFPPRRLPAQLDALEYRRKVRPVNVVHVGLDQNVREAALHGLERLRLQRVRAHHDVETAPEAGGVLDLLRDVDADDQARAQSQGRQHRDLAHPSAVDEQPPVDRDRRQETRDRAAGADRRSQGTLAQDDLLAAVDVGRDRRERDRRALDPHVVQDGIDIVLEVLGRDPRRLRHRERVEDPLLDEGDEIVQEPRARLAALLQEVEFGSLELLAENELPEALLGRRGAARRGVHASDERPDARPDDEVDRNLALFEGLQDPDVRQPARRAAPQRQPDFEPFEHPPTGLRAPSRAREPAPPGSGSI